MFDLKIPEVKDIIVGELAERGEWVLANVQTGATWPVNSQKVIFHGETIWIMPVMTDRFPAVAMKVAGTGRAESERLLLRFLSTLSWVQESGFLVDGVGGGSMPNPMGRRKEGGYSICEEFDLSYFPEPTDERAMLALALMREGRGLNHPGYSFLSLYRILELALGRGWQRQVAWINEQIAKGLLRHGVKDALEEIGKQGVTDIGAHLYASGRCAMAHASGDPVIDPDDPADARRLWSERPIMLALAERAIEEVFGVETRGTQYRKHLYELDGFKRLLGDELTAHLVRGDDPAEQHNVDIPNIGIQLRRKPSFAPLSNLAVKKMVRDGPHSVVLIFESSDGRTKFRFRLDFADERLVFNLDRDIGHTDLGDADSAEAMAEIARFSKEYFGNGKLRIVDAETGDLISRKDAFIPMNMYLDHEAANADIARWKALAAERRERDARYADEVARHSQGYDVKIVYGRARFA